MQATKTIWSGRKQMTITPIEDRLHDKITVQDNGCWIWTCATNNIGYGMIYDHDHGSMRTAHRVMAELHGMDIKGKCVCHTCDNPRCCNPDHLWVGTHQQNMADCAAKGRSKKGKGMPQGYHAPRTVCVACHANLPNNLYARYKHGPSCARLNKE